MPSTLSNVAPTLLPSTVSAPIFEKAAETSAVMPLARRVPLALTAQTDIPVSMDAPVAGWVGEGERKPVGKGGVGTKRMKGKKVALLLPVSEEVVRSNAAGLYDQLRQDLPLAISRAFDYAAIHGKDLRTGGAGPFDDYLAMTDNAVTLGTTTAANGGLYVDLVTGEKKVVDAGYDFTGFAADPRLRPTLKLQVDTQGHPIWVDSPQTGTNGGSLIGYPAFYNRGVSGVYRRSGNATWAITIGTGTPASGDFTIASGGHTAKLAYNVSADDMQTAIRAWGDFYKDASVTLQSKVYTIAFGTGQGASFAIAANTVQTSAPADVPITAGVPSGKSPDTGTRAIGGDFTQCAYGVGMDLTIRVSNEATYVDDNSNVVSAFQNNLVLLLVEAYYGFVVGDPDAFVAYTAS